MSIVRMMQMTVHQIIDMIAMWHGRMPTARTVYVIGRMPAASMAAGTLVGIGSAYIQRMLLDNPSLGLVMQMAVVKKINMIPMLDCGVPAVLSVNMRMIFVCMVHRHYLPAFYLAKPR